MRLFNKYLILTIVIAAPHRAAESAANLPEQRLEEIQNELRIRRERREDALANIGVVCTPEVRPIEWYGQRHDLMFEDVQVAAFAEIYLTFSKKEVMVSGRVARLRMSVTRQNVAVDEALAIIRRTLAEGHVESRDFGEDIVVWYASPSQMNKKK